MDGRNMFYCRVEKKHWFGGTPVYHDCHYSYNLQDIIKSYSEDFGEEPTFVYRERIGFDRYRIITDSETQRVTLKPEGVTIFAFND